MAETLYQLLSAPFPESDLEWKVQSCGEKNNGEIWARCVPYLTNRAIQDRLDQVVGPENWRNHFTTVGKDQEGVLCGISIRIGGHGGEWVEKQDGAEITDIEPLKGGLSNAMKRAAVQWGIGRFLYGINDTWAIIDQNGIYRGKTKDGKYFNWNPPRLNLAHQAQQQAEPARPITATVVKKPAVADSSPTTTTATTSKATAQTTDADLKIEADDLYTRLVGRNGILHKNYQPLVKALYDGAPSRQDRCSALNALLRSVSDVVKVMGKQGAADQLEEITLGLPIDRLKPSAQDAEEWLHAFVTLAETGAIK
jgi:hypothetical protein